MKNRLETRIYTFDGEDEDGLSIRQDGNGKTYIEGYFIRYDKESRPFGPTDDSLREVIKKGAFDESVTNDDIFALYAHNRENVLGRKGAGTMSIASNSRGVKVSINPSEHYQYVVDGIRRGDIKEASFGFYVQDDDDYEIYRLKGKDYLIREIKKAKLTEVSIVPRGQYETDITVAQRSLENFLQSEKSDSAEKDYDYLVRYHNLNRSL